MISSETTDRKSTDSVVSNGRRGADDANSGFSPRGSERRCTELLRGSPERSSGEAETSRNGR